MNRKFVMATSFGILLLALFGLAGTQYEKVADLTILGFYAAFLLALIFYKLHLWIKYRNESSKREAVINSTQLFPPKLMRFIFDEDLPTAEEYPAKPNQPPAAEARKRRG